MIEFRLEPKHKSCHLTPRKVTSVFEVEAVLYKEVLRWGVSIYWGTEWENFDKSYIIIKGEV